MAERGRFALVTGASSGIGRAIALQLAEDGWRLALTGRNQMRLDAVSQACSLFNNGDVVSAAFDICDARRLECFVNALGPVDLLVCNHGVLDGRRDGEKMESLATALDIVETNLQATIVAMHAVITEMRDAGKGQIVLVTSLAGLAPLADAPAYSASKAGIIAYGLGLREALREDGIGVSVICPGYVATPMGDEHIGYRPHEVPAKEAARRILKAGLANRRLSGFPAPLWPMALFANIVPAGLNRLITRGLRFTVRKR